MAILPSFRKPTLAPIDADGNRAALFALTALILAAMFTRMRDGTGVGEVARFIESAGGLAETV